MLNMAKKKKYYKSNEKQVGARLTGFDFSDFDAHGVKGIDVFRYGMMNIKKEHASPKEVKLLSKIILVENRMAERELNQMADELLLKKLYEQLEDIKGFTIEKQEKLIKLLQKEFDVFIEDNKYEDCDLSDFYTIKRDAITIHASKFDRTYEQAVELFDKYHEDMEQQSVLENTRTIEHE